MGAVSLLLALTHAAPPVFHGLVLVEPMLVPEWGEKLVGTFLAKGAQGRRDVWESKSSAREVLGARNGFKEWDPRVLDIFCVRPYILLYIAEVGFGEDTCLPLRHVCFR